MECVAYLSFAGICVIFTNQILLIEQFHASANTQFNRCDAISSSERSKISAKMSHVFHSLPLNVVRNSRCTMSRENVKQLQKFIRKIEKLNVDVTKLSAVRNRNSLKMSWKYLSTGFGILFTAILLLSNIKLYRSGNCLISMPNALSHAFRKPENCDFCQNVTEIVRVANIVSTEFERNFAYNARPVIVTDATVNWTASNTFDFWYFQRVYRSADESNGDELNCQFFPYKTEFKTLREALSIPTERVNYEHGTQPWYFGWSNCNYEVAQQLRQHYGRPYFLPETSENAATDWIFMGGPGLGAHMHVDNVRLPSWQAQIKGSKKWTLAPPPECYYQCTTFAATVQAGEISK